MIKFLKIVIIIFLWFNTATAVSEATEESISDTKELFNQLSKKLNQRLLEISEPNLKENKEKIALGNFFDLFNNCEIDETKEIEFDTEDDPYYPKKYQYCNFSFTKNKIKEDGKPYILLKHYGFWPSVIKITDEAERYKTENLYRRLRVKTERFFESFREDIFAEYDKTYRQFSLINFEMFLLASPDNNKIELLKLYLDYNLSRIRLLIKDTSEDLCFDAISKFIVPFSNKHDLKENKWKEFSEKYKNKANYPNGNPVFTYKRGYTYSLPANKKIILQCKYIPNIEDKNFFWLTEIYFTDSKIYKCIIGKNTIKSPKLNLKIIWNEITKEFFS